MKTKRAEAEIRALVDSFVDDLTGLIRQSAVEALQETLLDGQAPATAPARPRGKAGKKAKKKGTRRKGRKKAGRRVRRSPEEIQKAKDAIVRYVRSNPGCAMGDLSAALGEDPVTIRAQVNELLDEGALRKEGERRGTRYFGGNRRGAGKSKTKKKTGRRKTKKKAARKR